MAPRRRPKQGMWAAELGLAITAGLAVSAVNRVIAALLAAHGCWSDNGHNVAAVDFVEHSDSSSSDHSST